MKPCESYQFKSFTIKIFEELDSTNNQALLMAKNQQIFDKEILVAKAQKSGRGRLDRNWVSPIGNLYFSLVLQPKITLQQIQQVPFLAACGLNIAISKQFQRQQISAKILNKWPNDLLINNKKIAGILIENLSSQNICEYLIIGVGININSCPDNTKFPADFLNNFCTVNHRELLNSFIEEFSIIFQNWLDFGFKNIRNLWLQNAYKLNSEISLELGESKLVGIFENIDEEGNLILKTQGIISKINYGDVS